MSISHGFNAGPSGETERTWGDPDNWIRIELGRRAYVFIGVYGVGSDPGSGIGGSSRGGDKRLLANQKGRKQRKENTAAN